VIVAGPGIHLAFDYDFLQGAGDDDAFSAYLLDAATGTAVGSAYALFIDDSATGSASFDLSPLAGSVLGLQFQLERLAGDAAGGSRVSLSNVRLEAAAIPVVGPLWLIVAGLPAPLGRRRVRAVAVRAD
jgi:hypothetical protein